MRHAGHEGLVKQNNKYWWALIYETFVGSAFHAFKLFSKHWKVKFSQLLQNHRTTEELRLAGTSVGCLVQDLPHQGQVFLGPVFPPVSGAWNSWKPILVVKIEAKTTLSTSAFSMPFVTRRTPTPFSSRPVFSPCLSSAVDIEALLVARHVPHQIQLQMDFGFLELSAWKQISWFSLLIPGSETLWNLLNRYHPGFRSS